MDNGQWIMSQHECISCNDLMIIIESIIQMRSNFHYQPSDKMSPATLSLMQELKRTQQEIQQKTRQLLLAKNQEQNIRHPQYNSRQPDNEALRQEFYDIPPTTKEQERLQERDFFSRFSNNNDGQVKKEAYKNQLDRQIQSKRQESVDKQRREQMADDVWSNVLKGNRGDSGNRSSSPGYQGPNSRVTEDVRESRNTREEPPKYTKPPRVTQNTDLGEEQLRQQKIKQEKKRLYYQELNKQIEEEKRRKEEEKRIAKEMKIDTFQSKFPVPSKSQEKPNPSKGQDSGNNEARQSRMADSKGDQAEEQRILKKKYTKGLIDIEEYEKDLRLIQLKYGNKSQNYEKRKIQVAYNEENRNESARQYKQQPIRKVEPQVIRGDPNQSFHNPHPIGTSRHIYSESLIQQPTQYYPIYQPLQPHQQSPVPHPYQVPPLQQTNPSPSMDPYQYASILQQNQLQLFQKMMEGMKEIIATTLMYDRKKGQGPRAVETGQRPYLNTIETEEYKSIPRQIPLRQLKSPQLTKINSPSPRNFMMEPSLSLQNIKIACQSIDESKNFFKRPPKVKAFKKFDYVEKMGGSTLEIPNTSCFVTSGDGFQKLQRSFERDLMKFKQSQLSHQIQSIKDQKPYFKKKTPPVQQAQIEAMTFKSLGIQKKEYNPASKQSIEQQCDDYNFYNPQPVKPNKWKSPAGSSKKIPTDSNREIEVKKEQRVEESKQNNLNQQFNQGIFGFPTFVVDDISELRKQLKKQGPQQKNSAILERSTYQVKKPIVIINEPEEESVEFRVPKPKAVYDVESIGVQSKSELEEFLRPHHSSSSKSLKRYSSSIKGAEDSIDAESNFESSIPKLITNPDVMKISRNKIQQIKKSKDGILLDFMALSSPSKKDQYKLPHNHYTYEEEITEKIEQPSHHQYLQTPHSIDYRSNRPEQYHEESQTILSKYQQSGMREQSQLNYSREPSSLTSLQQARKKAKEGRTRQKKQSSLLTINTLEQLEREIKKKDPPEESVIKKMKPSPVLLKNPKELLGMLDEMADVDEDEEYPHVFDSYCQN